MEPLSFCRTILTNTVAACCSLLAIGGYVAPGCWSADPCPAGLLVAILSSKTFGWAFAGRVAHAQRRAFQNVINSWCDHTDTIRAMKEVSKLVPQNLGAQQEIYDCAEGEVTPHQILGLRHKSLAHRRHFFVRLTFGVWEVGGCGGAMIR